MRWLRDNAGWVSIAVGLAAGLSALYVRDALAETKTRVSVLEALFPELKQDLRDIKSAQEETARDVKRLLDER